MASQCSRLFWSGFKLAQSYRPISVGKLSSVQAHSSQTPTVNVAFRAFVKTWSIEVESVSLSLTLCASVSIWRRGHWTDLISRDFFARVSVKSRQSGAGQASTLFIASLYLRRWADG
ncbi:hypothetical protein BaRGS_00005891 [Batillaria attramentaria]|uniref:Uncharacterized protein n=1 Tax=Batillaria attramentaria TaxID=370345 RepID=A0ABD0LUG5_9CAEN